VKESLSPDPNPDFERLLLEFFWVHVAFTLGYFTHILKLRREILISVMVVTIFGYMYQLIKACVGVLSYNRKMGYSIFQVEDTVHYFVVIEIVTFATNLLVLILYLLPASFRYERQVRRVGQINNGYDDGFVRQPA
jgi:hypothetical protein